MITVLIKHAGKIQDDQEIFFHVLLDQAARLVRILPKFTAQELGSMFELLSKIQTMVQSLDTSKFLPNLQGDDVLEITLVQYQADFEKATKGIIPILKALPTRPEIFMDLEKYAQDYAILLPKVQAWFRSMSKNQAHTLIQYLGNADLDRGSYEWIFLDSYIKDYTQNNRRRDNVRKFYHFIFGAED